MTSIFDGLDDDLDAIISAPIRAPQDRPVMPAAEGHFNPCQKCHGRGRFISYSGRDCGPCFSCKGTRGSLTKTAPAVLAANRTKAAERKAADAEASMDLFSTEYPAEAAWMKERAGRFDFAREMIEAVRKFGDLTLNQMAAVRRCMVQDAERTKAAVAKREAASGEIDVSKLDEAFAVARANGALVASIRTGDICFSLAKASGRNPGAIYCKTRAGGEYLGKIAGGRFTASFECTEAHKATIVEAAADPKAAALRYAAITNECSVCGRLLTDPVSKAAGIGPKCAGKFGW